MTRATTDLYATVSSRLPPSLREAIDLLIEVPEGDARSGLLRLKDYPKSANAAIRQLGQLGRKYDAGDLRRFAKPKRDALIACYLVEARKTLLDQIVEMNHLFLTGINRLSRHAVEKQRKSCAAAPATGCTACSAPSTRWSWPRDRRPSPPFATPSGRRR